MARLDQPILQPPVTIRSVRPQDADALVDYLLKTTSQTDNLTFEPDERAMFADEPLFLESLEASANSLALIALVEQRIVGSLTFIGGKRPKTAHSGEFGLSVDRQWWGLGIGKALMRTLVDWASGHGITRIALEVRSDNQRAIGLYRSFGFEEEGTRSHALNIGGRYVDLLCMGLTLGEDLPSVGLIASEGCRTRLVKPVRIRTLESSDASDVLDCVARIARETPFLEIGTEGLGLSLAEEQAILDSYAQQHGKIYLGAFTSAGKLVGLLACASTPRRRLSHACEFSLMVLDAFRSNGIGSALLGRMLLWARRSQIHRVSLHVHAHNHRAIALYERFGFTRETLLRRAFLQEGAYFDCIGMALLLE